MTYSIKLPATLDNKKRPPPQYSSALEAVYHLGLFGLLGIEHWHWAFAICYGDLLASYPDRPVPRIWLLQLPCRQTRHYSGPDCVPLVK